MRIVIKSLLLIFLIAVFAASLLTGCNMQEKETVTLLGTNAAGNDASSFFVINPDGTLDPFVIPDNKVFVVTDMGITFRNATPDRTVYVQLYIFNLNFLASFQDVTVADANGDGGLHASLQTGLKIAPNTVFGVRASSGGAVDPDGIAVTLHGYLE
jgi:ABC-type transport system substrate-binding protein